MIDHSDSHRFGLKVDRVAYKDGPWFLKPRSIWTEKIFLDSESDLNIFKKVFITENPCQLEDFDSYGYSKDVSSFLAAESQINIKNFSSNVGKLLAFATFFGINDLHSQNIKILKVGNQFLPVPIDIENCLVDHKTCAETLLIPSNLIDFKLAGLNGNLSCELFNSVDSDNLLNDFIITFTTLLKLDFDYLVTFFNSFEDKHQRVILRDTKEYYLFMKQEYSIDLLLEAEIFQMNYGDIPYFFTDKKSKALYFYESPTKIKMIDPMHFKNKLDRYTLDTNDYFQKSRLDKLLMNSATHLVKIFKRNFKLHSGSEYKIQINDLDFILETTNFKTRAKF